MGHDMLTRCLTSTSDKYSKLSNCNKTSNLFSLYHRVPGIINKHATNILWNVCLSSWESIFTCFQTLRLRKNVAFYTKQQSELIIIKRRRNKFTFVHVSKQSVSLSVVYWTLSVRVNSTYKTLTDNKYCAIFPLCDTKNTLEYILQLGYRSLCTALN